MVCHIGLTIEIKSYIFDLSTVIFIKVVNLALDINELSFSLTASSKMEIHVVAINSFGTNTRLSILIVVVPVALFILRKMSALRSKVLKITRNEFTNPIIIKFIDIWKFSHNIVCRNIQSFISSNGTIIVEVIVIEKSVHDHISIILEIVLITIDGLPSFDW